MANIKENERSSTEKRLSPFIKKLWGIMNDTNLHSIIRWSEQGTTICISNSILFCRSVLPHYFKHNNWHSFVRQLNLYGFRKVYHFNIAIDYASGRQETVWQFKHRHFHRNGEGSLLLIQRKLPLCQTVALTKEQKIKSLLSDIEQRLAQAEKAHEQVKIETLLLRQQHQDQKKMLSKLMEEVVNVTKKLTDSLPSSNPCASCCTSSPHQTASKCNIYNCGVCPRKGSSGVDNDCTNSCGIERAHTSNCGSSSSESTKDQHSLPPLSDIISSIPKE